MHHCNFLYASMIFFFGLDSTQNGPKLVLDLRVQPCPSFDSFSPEPLFPSPPRFASLFWLCFRFPSLLCPFYQARVFFFCLWLTDDYDEWVVAGGEG